MPAPTGDAAGPPAPREPADEPAADPAAHATADAGVDPGADPAGGGTVHHDAVSSGPHGTEHLPRKGLPAKGPHLRVVDLDVQPVIVAIAFTLFITMLAAIATSGVTATLLVLAGLFAFALDPVVVRIQQRFNLRRGYAVGLLMGSAVLVVVVAITVLGPQTVEQARSFQKDLPHVLDGLKDLPVVGPTLAANDVPGQIQKWAAKLPKQLAGDTSQITNAAETITSVLLGAIAVTLIMVALLIDGPWLVGGAQRLIPPNRRDTAHHVGGILSRVIGRYFAGSLLLATLQGVQVLITGLILGVPLSPLLAVWAAVWNLVPQLGGAIGGVVFVLVAFTQGATTGVIAAAVFMLYITFANNVLLPVILGKAVNISPLTTMIATIVGFAVAGIVGAMLAVPVLGAGKAMYLELRVGNIDEIDDGDERGPPSPFQRLRARVRPEPDPSPA